MDTTIQPCDEKKTHSRESGVQKPVLDTINSALIEESQKTVWQDEDCHSVLNIEHESNNASFAGTFNQNDAQDPLDVSPSQTDDDCTFV